MITLPSDVLLLGYLCWGVGSLKLLRNKLTNIACSPV